MALDVGQHGEWQIPQVGMVIPPRMVHPFGVRAAAQNLRVPLLKLLVQLSEACDLCRTNEREILWPKEIDLPFAFVVEVSKRFECGFRVFLDADRGRQRVRWKFFSNT